MNRNQLKFIAITAMLLDHISAFFIPITTPIGLIMRFIGRITAPVMCCFVAEGFRYTSSHKKYGTRLFIFAVISQFAFGFAHNTWNRFNMIFTLFLSFLILWIYENCKSEFVKITAILILISATYFCDWGIIAPMWTLSFHILRKNKTEKILGFTLISLIHILTSTANGILTGGEWYSQLWQAGVFMFIPLFLMYNGEGGAKNFFSKWFFYIIYPLHLLIIGFVLKK